MNSKASIILINMRVRPNPSLSAALLIVPERTFEACSNMLYLRTTNSTQSNNLNLLSGNTEMFLAVAAGIDCPQTPS